MNAKADKEERQTKQDGNTSKQIANYQTRLDNKHHKESTKCINDIKCDKLNVE